MAKVSEITEPYFSHDISSRCDEKILKMFFAFRKMAKTMDKSELESFVALGAYGIFWSVVEYMHRNTLSTNDVDVIADDLRIDEKFVKNVLNDFDLFRIENETYVSDRILRNINKQEEVSEQKSKVAKNSWAIRNLKKVYEEIFEVEPALSSKGIKTFIKYSETIADFKDKLPDILYTLKTLKFENNPKFNPNIDWLLDENHLTKLVNCEYGKLKSWSEEKNRRKQAEKAAAEQAKEEEKQKQEQQFNIETVCNKCDAVDLLVENSAYIPQMNKLTCFEPYRGLLKKFDIPEREIIELKKKQLELKNA